MLRVMLIGGNSVPLTCGADSAQEVDLICRDDAAKHTATAGGCQPSVRAGPAQASRQASPPAGAARGGSMGSHLVATVALTIGVPAHPGRTALPQRFLEAMSL